MQANAVDRRDLQLAGNHVAHLVQAVAEVSVNLEDLAAGLKKRPALVSEREVAPSAIHEHDLELVFDGADLLADGTLRDPVDDGGFREAAGVGEVAKDFERIDIHAA